MSLYTLIIVTFIVFMAINVIIGLRGRKHASTTKDFLTASGQSGIWFIIASAVGASIGSGVVIGTTQYAVKQGVAGAWYAIACGIACVVHAFVMTRFIYRNKLVSFSDYFKRRYDSNFIVLLYSGIGPFACAASMGGQLVAAKAIFQAFGIDPTIGLVITAAVMLVYTMFAGLWGSYATAVFQVGVIIVGVLVVGISMFTQGGVAEIHAFYPAEKFDLFNISPELWMMFVGPMVLSVLVDQTSVQRAASAKTEATAFWGHLLSCIPLFLFGWLMVYIGMSSLRLPMWIGRNKVLDYMFLNEDFTGRQCYELGLASKVVADELVEVVGLATAKKMSKAAPIAVKYYKDCVRKATQNNIEEARAFELKAAEIVFATEDSKIGLKSVVENHGVPNCEFYGR